MNQAESSVDIKGRPHVQSMSDRELLEEMVTAMRSTQDTVEAFVKHMSNNPMLSMFMKRMGG